jgi:hypothetical protein
MVFDRSLRVAAIPTFRGAGVARLTCSKTFMRAERDTRRASEAVAVRCFVTVKSSVSPTMNGGRDFLSCERQRDTDCPFFFFFLILWLKGLKKGIGKVVEFTRSAVRSLYARLNVIFRPYFPPVSFLERLSPLFPPTPEASKTAPRNFRPYFPRFGFS